MQSAATLADLLTVGQTAKAVKRCKKTIQDMIRRREIATIIVAGRHYIDPADLRKIPRRKAGRPKVV